MGWDITYHPVGAEEISSIYFNGLTDPSICQSVISRFGIDDFYAERLKSRFAEAREIGRDVPFNKGHAFYVAIIAGFLRKHHYIRGGAFSFLADDPIMSRYITEWQTLVPAEYRDLHFDNCLTENYCGGVYLSCESLKALRHDYDSDAHIRSKVDEIFSDGRLALFWKSVDEAIAQGLGLVEAAEVVEPNPFDLNSTSSLTNLFNCYPEGALLYADTAIQQIAEATQNTPPQATKKGFFARLFGK